MLLKSEGPALYPNAAGNRVPYEQLTDSDRRSLLASWGYLDQLDQAVDMVRAGSLFGRMLIDALGHLAANDEALSEQVRAAVPQRQRGRPERWTLRARREFLSMYYTQWAIHNGTRDELLSELAERYALDTTQAVEDLISSSRKRLSDDRTLRLLQSVCEQMRAERSSKGDE